MSGAPAHLLFCLPRGLDAAADLRRFESGLAPPVGGIVLLLHRMLRDDWLRAQTVVIEATVFCDSFCYDRR